MSDKLNLYDIYEQNLNFFFGAGASFGFLPTLALRIRNEVGEPYTFETLAKDLEKGRHDKLYSLLFMLYYGKCIQPGLPLLQDGDLKPEQESVISDYKNFLMTLLAVLSRQSSSDKKSNIYTTNYDNCFELAGDSITSENLFTCVFNDGSAGFQQRRFHTKNFNNRVIQKGIFDKHSEFIPQINLLHPHGSVYWERFEQKIKVNYGQSNYQIEFDLNQSTLLLEFDDLLNDPRSVWSDLIEFADDKVAEFTALNEKPFWDSYNTIPIVNPTKWKFHETVFEEAYYQILRHLSFELERPNSVLITFGFSFADEHILHLVQRSLSNPSLTVFVSCYNDAEKSAMKEKFKGYPNVKFLTIDDDLTFQRFNKRVFTLAKDCD
ncbi:SIR2 family protein [Shewanella baltica]|uniref:SIR2 family protein n=1 Tax=Shewanella baltica TaxID=62322 RepID=UPI003CFEE556